MPRKSLPIATRRSILHEAGYRCGNPNCKTILTLEIHHLDRVSDGGADTEDNLLALCPNCHSLHHQGVIPRDSLRAWKQLLRSLNQAFDARQVDTLLCLEEINAVGLTGDGLLAYSSLLASGYVEWDRLHLDSYRIRLSEKGKVFVAAWRQGDLAAASNWKQSEEADNNWLESDG